MHLNSATLGMMLIGLGVVDLKRVRLFENWDAAPFDTVKTPALNHC